MQITLRTAVLALLALAASLLVYACGGDDDEVDVDLGPDPATLTPPTAPFYVEGVVQPEGEVRDDLEAALSRLLNSDDPAAAIRDALDSDSDADDIRFSEDVEPWLGPRAGVFLTGFDNEGEGAGILAIGDRGEAEAAIDRIVEREDRPPEQRSYEGVDYQVSADEGGALGIVEDFVVLASDPESFESVVDASAGDSLAELPEASEALEQAPDERVFVAYADARGVLDAIEDSGELNADTRRQLEEQIGDAEGAFAAWGTADAEAMAVEYAGPAGEDPGEVADLLDGMPQGSWLAFGAGGQGESLRGFVEGFQSGLEQLPRGQADQVRGQIEDAIGLDLKRDLRWIGDIGGFVEGTSIFGLGGGVVIEATDEADAGRALSKLESALGRSGELEVSPLEEGEGFRAAVPGTPFGVEVELREGNVVIAAGGSSVADVLTPGSTLADSERFNSAQEALGEGFTPGLFLDFTAVLSLAESTGQQTNDPSFEQFRRALGSLDFAIAGTSIDGDRASGRFVLGLRESEGSEAGTAATLVP